MLASRSRVAGPWNRKGGGAWIRWTLAPAMFAILAGAAGCAPREVPVVFNVENARAHVAMLAETIGSRPVGSAANAKARAYLIDQLRFFGYDVRVQEVDAARPELGATVRVANIIAIKAGAHAEAIGLVAHYDSVPEGPGALDDGLGVSVCLEAARVLAAQADRRYSVMVILTDGEEAGLFGAAAAVTDPDVTARLRAYFNVEAIGASGPSVLFEAGPHAFELLRAWAAAAPRPHGSSYATEIYKRLPNDTDFTLFRAAGIPGLNFAPIGDSYPYHTSRDRAERLSADTIRQTGDNVVALAYALDRSDIAGLSSRASTPAFGTRLAAGPLAREDVRFFDIARQRAFVYGPIVGRTIAVVAVLLALFAWIRMLRATLEAGVWRLIVTGLWSLIALATAGGAMLGAIWLLRAIRETYHPWYAHPTRLMLLLVVAGIGAPWYITRLMSILPQAVRSHRTPQAVWTMALPVWIGLAVAAEYAVPAAAHLWTWPLLFAGLLLAISPARMPAFIRLVSLLLAVVTALFWLPDGIDFFRFLIALFARLPFITPIWIYPAFLFLAGLMLAPPCVAIVAGLVRGRTMHAVVGGLWALAFAVTVGLAYFGHAYTPDRPLRRIAIYTQDAPSQRAWWEVGSHEPGLELNTGTTPNQWQLQPAGTAPAMSVALWPLPAPFVFRSNATAVPLPADIGATIGIRETAAIDITIVPKQEGLRVDFVLPPDVRPTRANLPGLVQEPDRRWRASYTAVPMSGVAFRAEVPPELAARLSETAVVVSSARAPEAEGPRVPAWAPQERADWIIRSRWIVLPTQLPNLNAPSPGTLPFNLTPAPPGTPESGVPALPPAGAPSAIPGAPAPAPTAPPAQAPRQTSPSPSASPNRLLGKPRPARPVNAD